MAEGNEVCGDGYILGAELRSFTSAMMGTRTTTTGAHHTCRVECGYTCSGGTATTADTCGTTCGDSIKTGAEACDDGNTVDGDGCSGDCGAVEDGYACVESGPCSGSTCDTVCGDGKRIGHEDCDDGDTVSDDGCSSACTVECGYTCMGETPDGCTSSCGDGVRAGDEACDDGNAIDNDGCSSTCTLEAGYSCDLTACQTSVCSEVCGNGVRTPGEGCDDGNTCQMTDARRHARWNAGTHAAGESPTCARRHAGTRCWRARGMRRRQTIGSMTDAARCTLEARVLMHVTECLSVCHL